MFYSRTWAQSVILPLLGLIPLLLSIASFVYDYYSDAELTIEYYQNAFSNNGHLNGNNVNTYSIRDTFYFFQFYFTAPPKKIPKIHLIIERILIFL